MIIKRHAESRGHTNHGWLNSYHTFSFANYYDPQEIGFSDLLVINDDTVSAGRGFGTHPHDNMEILSYVLKGTLTHQDSMGNGSTIKRGDVQLMSAGTGVTHSEMNGSNSESVHFLQIWIMLNVKNEKPSYQQNHISDEKKYNQFCLLLSNDGEKNTLKVKQDIKVYAGIFSNIEPYIFLLNTKRYYYIHVAQGNVEINGETFKEGDGARIIDEDSLSITHGQQAEVLLFDLRPHQLPTRV